MKKTLTVNAQAVLEAVRNAPYHSTALEVYEIVRQEQPHIGLASIYRILRSLVEQGYIRELHLGDESSQYDGHIARHDHAICRVCGKLVDIPVDVAFSSQALQEAAFTVGMVLETHEVRLYGCCLSCQAAQEDKKATKD